MHMPTSLKSFLPVSACAAALFLTLTPGTEAVTPANGAQVAVQMIGTGVDGLVDPQAKSGGLTLTDYTVFKFPDGILVAKAEVDVREATLGQQGVTHLVGSFPDPNGNDVIYGTGAYAGATGRVRLSGGVDMSNLGNGEIGFNCLFLIDLD